ncbi:penicillin-binding Tp47 domain C-containing protein [Agathobaculum sp.]|uniref:penicillin-binding Tp47 domain C-containing protein n=1 Tax=Agathobaculum sp. TaxID=2048138 RepID=UPI003FD8F5DB
MKCKNTIAMVLAGAMLLPSNAFAADLSQYKDFPNDWSAKSLEQAIDDGLLNGSNGMIDAKGLLTRAQMAAIVSRSFGAAKTASLDDYRDVLPSAWYYSDMGKAVKMGAFQGANGLLNPDAPITREEAFTVLARAFALEGGGSATLKDFVDGGTVSSWASESVAALVAGGYVNGANGMLNLKNNITRAEFAKVITGMAASYVGAEGVSGKTVEGNVIVRESGASLSGMTINGDLIIADSADKASLDNVKVTGRIVIRGGADAVSIKDTTAGKGVLVSSPNGAAAISVSGGSVGTVTAKSDLSLSGSVSNVAVTDKATLTVEKNASVGTVTVSAAGSKVTGDGKVTNVQANANNVTVTSKGTKVTAGSGVSGVKAGDKAVEAGKTETVGTASTSSGGSSGGGSSSSRSDYSYVLMNIPYDEFYKAELNENAAAVDAVSSATKNKTRSGLAAGSYHVNADGSDITGVIYPVRVKTSDLSGLTQVTDSSSVSITTTLKGKTSTTEYKGQNALFESESHSYYYLSSTPSFYKEATLSDGKWTFGKATGAASEGTATIAKFKTSGHHTDYEIKVESDKITKGQKVYAVVVTDTDGNSYGLRHVAEIWHAIELGFEADSALVGKTISAVTYYTDDGVIKLNLAEKLHVPVISGAKAEVAKSAADAKETTLTLSGFPEDFAQNVKVPEGMSYADGKINFGSALPGSYTVTVSDAKGKYADVTANFTVSTSKVAAKYDSESVSLKAADGANDAALANYLKNITSVKVGDKEYAATDKDAVTIINSNGYLDLTAKPFADMKSGSSYTITVKANYYKDQEFTVTIPEHIYAYAAVPYDEYWKNEGVDLSGSDWDASSDEVDRDDGRGHQEHDKGAFDAVSRATTNHGLHRGSFQQSVVIHTADKDYHPVSWTDADNFVDADGKTYNKKEIGITSYNITGIKYVPVKVSSSDFVDFCKNYTVTQNGETMQGGYGEVNLSAYTAVAAVDSTTNGLKEVTKNGSTFSFGARQTGSGSGIKGETLKNADEAITAAPKEYSGNFGEMLRVDLNNNYGDLGSHMQTVVWKYYGDGDTVLATYGTKFAADDWMHKSMGIQLGLTDSLRFKLPEGKDGTGKWTLTVYALGYSDTTYEVTVTADNLPKAVEPMTTEQRTQLTNLAKQAKDLLPNYPDTSTTNEAELKKHYDEAAALLENKDATSAAAAELIGELPGLIQAVKDERAAEPTTTVKYGQYTISNDSLDDPYTVKLKVTVNTDGTIQLVEDNATDTAVSDNDSYWSKAKAMFEKFVGLTKDGASALKTDPDGGKADKVDAISRATVSSNAIKEAVLDALKD